MIIARGWNGTLWVMRIAAPLVFVAALGLCVWAVETARYGAAVVDGLCIAVNAVLTWIEWFVFKPNLGG